MIESGAFLKKYPSDIYMGHFFKKSFSRTLALWLFIKKVKNGPFLSNLGYPIKSINPILDPTLWNYGYPLFIIMITFMKVIPSR